MISHLIKEDSDEGISPVPTADVESKVVRVWKVAGCYHMNPEIAMLQIGQIKIFRSRLPCSTFFIRFLSDPSPIIGNACQ